MVNTILAKRVNHIVAKGDNPAWPKGSKSRGFSIISNFQFSIIKMSETTKKKNVWSLVLKIIVTVATALAGVFGVASCVA